MQEVILVIHLLLALVIIGLVLLQRSSGGGLGIGGGGGLGDFASARSTANALTKATTICAFMFFATSISLGYIAKGSSNKGLLESYGGEVPAAAAPAVPTPESLPAAEAGAAPVPVVPATPAAPAAAAPAPAVPASATPEPPVPTQ